MVATKLLVVQLVLRCQSLTFSECKTTGHLDFRATALPGATETAGGALAAFVCQVGSDFGIANAVVAGFLVSIISLLHIMSVGLVPV